MTGGEGKATMVKRPDRVGGDQVRTARFFTFGSPLPNLLPVSTDAFPRLQVHAGQSSLVARKGAGRDSSMDRWGATKQ